ncbi:MAG: hypothetical protein DRJ50_09145 [Actinobacteria bacterium]|nr:MAG: hypothetical protein DRJ50_09145 [Actinomycetota bacterium]
MAGCFFSMLDAAQWFRADAADGTILTEAKPLSMTVNFDADTGDIVSAEFECHPDVPAEVREQVARVFLHVDLCFDIPPS